MMSFLEYIKEAKEAKTDDGKEILLGGKDLNEADNQKASENKDLQAKDASHGDKSEVLPTTVKADGNNYEGDKPDVLDKKINESECEDDEALNESKKDEEFFETFMLMAMESVVKKSGKSRDEVVEIFKKDVKFRKFIVSEAKKLIKTFEDEIEKIK